MLSNLRNQPNRWGLLASAGMVLVLLFSFAVPAASFFQDTASQTSGGDGNQILTFTDGHGGNVFTAKDNLLNSATGAQGLNLGSHANFELSPTQNGILEFDLSSIPSSATIIDATLYLVNSYGTGGGQPISTIYSLSRANQAWQAGTRSLRQAYQGESTWDALAANGSGGVQTPWAGSEGANTAGVDYESKAIGQWSWNPSDMAGTQYRIALDTARVAGWFGTNNTNYGIIIRTSGGGGHVGQADHFTPAYRPKLVVRYTLSGDTPVQNTPEQSPATATPLSTALATRNPPVTPTPGTVVNTPTFIPSPTAQAQQQSSPTAVQPTPGRPSISGSFTDNFSDGQINSAWTVYGGSWNESGEIMSQSSSNRVSPKNLILSGVTLGSNQTITAKVRVDSWKENSIESRAGVSLFTSTSDGMGYSLLFARNHNTVRFLSGASSWGPSYSFAWESGVWYWFKLKMDNGKLYGKVWKDGASEPGDWPFSWSVSGRSGYPALYSGANGASSVSFDDVSVTGN